MPTYRVEQYEIHAQTYEVEASSEAEAIQKVLSGEADAVDNGLSYIEVDEDRGLSRDDHPDLRAELLELGVGVAEWGVPTIRSVQQL